MRNCKKFKMANCSFWIWRESNGQLFFT